MQKPNPKHVHRAQSAAVQEAASIFQIFDIVRNLNRTSFYKFRLNFSLLLNLPVALGAAIPSPYEGITPRHDVPFQDGIQPFPEAFCISHFSGVGL